MSEREQHGELADELEDQADTLADHSRSLGEEITDVRQDWERKRADAGVPGATPDWDDPDEDDEDQDGGAGGAEDDSAEDHPDEDD